ncbi:hypothetical protein JCM10207_000523 [Rhodosporidiobolus poonsookiae]
MLGFHHFGTFLLFCAVVLLVVATITSPVVDHMSLAKASFSVGGIDATVYFGVLGYCIEQSGATSCTSTGVGYDIPPILLTLARSTGTLSDTAENAINAVTSALVLHPVGCGVAFLAFLIAACSDRLGFLFASIITFVAAVIALVCMILDLLLFFFVRRWLRDNIDGVDISIEYSYGTWTTVAAFACLFVGMFAVCCACIAGRRRRRAQKW